MSDHVSASRDYYWWYDRSSKTLIVAVAFGLGPRIAAENLVSDLGLLLHDCMQWSGADQGSLPHMRDVDRFINFGVAKELVNYRPKFCIWIDCVDWLRTELPYHIRDYDLLLREVFFQSEVCDGKGDPKKWHDVAPLIKPKRRADTPDQNLMVLSFGGVSTPYSTDAHTIGMPLAYLRGLARCVAPNNGCRVVAFVPERLLARARLEQIIGERIELQPLGRESFAQAMSQCCLLVCQPGLYTPFEAMQIGLPFVLTHPMSFTQAMQLDRLASLGATCHPPVLKTSALTTSLQDIEAVEARWFSDTSAEWTDSATARAAEITEEFMADVLGAMRSPNRYIVASPVTSTITAAFIIQNEYPVKQ